MEQRASALQQRLEARRNMFLKNDASGASTYGTKTTTSAASGKTFVISHRKISILKHTGLKKSKKSSSLILYFRTKIHTSDQCEEVSGSSAIFFYGFLIPIWKKSPITNSFFVEIGTWFDNSFRARKASSENILHKRSAHLKNPFSSKAYISDFLELSVKPIAILCVTLWKNDTYVVVSFEFLKNIVLLFVCFGHLWSHEGIAVLRNVLDHLISRALLQNIMRWSTWVWAIVHKNQRRKLRHFSFFEYAYGMARPLFTRE